jgi:hypothetical protein
MTGSKLLTAIVVSTAIVASSSVGALARTNKLDAYAQAPRHPSEMDIRKECYGEAKKLWPSTSQDLQTARDYAYRACAFDHGVRDP